MNKQVILIILAGLTSMLLSIVLYVIVSTTGIILKPNPSCNFRDKVYLKDFVVTLDGTLENDHKVDTSHVGTKKLKIIYKNKYGFYKIKEFNLEIKDITKPTILVNNDYTVEVGYEKKIRRCNIMCR